MDLGIVGLGRMGLNMAIRLQRDGHRVVGTNRNLGKVREAEGLGIVGSDSVEEMVSKLTAPRVV